MAGLPRIVSNTAAFLFVKELVTPWDKTKAFKAGVIDKDGNLLVHVKDMTSDQKDTYTYWHRLIFNIKRLLEKLPGGRMKIASYAAALYLIKESVAETEEKQYISEQFVQHYKIQQSLMESTSKIDLDIIEEGSYKLANSWVSLSGNIINAGTIINIDEDSSPIAIELGQQLFEIKSEGETLVVTKDLLEDTSSVAGTTTASIPNDTFAGHPVFDVSSGCFQRCRHGKPKYHKWMNYLDETDDHIRQYGLKNPAHGIVIRDRKTQSMMYLRRPRED